MIQPIFKESVGNEGLNLGVRLKKTTRDGS